MAAKKSISYAAQAADPPAPTVVTVGASRELTAYSLDVWFRGFYGKWLDNPDETLRWESREGIQLYDRMLRLDTQLAMCFRKRAGLVISLDWDVHPAGDSPREQEIADFIRDVFDRIADFETSRKAMFGGLSHGYRPAEIMFQHRPDGRIGIERFRTRDSERFRFDAENRLIYVSLAGNQAEPMPAWKFVVNTWGADETPYGRGLLRELYPLWYFKASAVRSYMRYLEKFGIPWIFGTLPDGVSKEQAEVFHNTLSIMLGGHVGTGPQGAGIQFLSADSQNVSNLFQTLVDQYVDRQYAKAILGQTLSTESESGTFALAKFQSRGQQAIAEEDALWQMAQLQPVVRTLVDLNFGPQEKYPRWVIPYEERTDLTALGNGLRGLVQIGLPVTVRWALQEAGLPVPPGVDEDQLLEIKQTNPLAGLFGPGAGPDPSGADDQTAGMSAAVAPALLAAEKKKPLRVVQAERRIAALQQMSDYAREDGYPVYAGWIDKQIKRMRGAKTLEALDAIWSPDIDDALAKHYADVFRSAELYGRAGYFKDGLERGFKYWSESGAREIPTQIIALDEFSGKLPLKPLDTTEAWAVYKDKIPMTWSEYKALDKSMRNKGFAIAQLESKYVAAGIHEGIQQALRNGLQLDDFIARARQLYELAGLTPLNPYHLRTVYLTNVHSALGAARWQELKRDTGRMRDFFPYLQYVTAGDDAVRPEHAALDGLILRRDDPQWDSIYPPNGFNCRCAVTEISVYEAESEQIEPDSALPADFHGPDPGFERAPQAA